MKNLSPQLSLLALALCLLGVAFLLAPAQAGGATILVESLPTSTATVTAPAAAEPLVVAQVILIPTATRTPTPINVGNFIWDDVDQDGRQDAGEPGIAGVTVQLWNSGKSQLIHQTITNASGIYSLVAPTPGQYRVRVLLPTALDQFTTKDQAADNDQLDSDINPTGGDFGFTDTYTFPSNLISITTIDAGIRRFRTPTPTRTPTPINVGNLVWDDLDLDGQQDAGEPGIAGVTVQLWNGGKTQLIAQTTTNASGIYSLVAPTPGQYRVRVLLPSVLDQFTNKDQSGVSDLLDSDINTAAPDAGFTDIYTFASNLISITTIDAGIRRYKTPTPTRTPTPINVGNFVWHDLNANGIQDAGEPGIPGVTVQLWNGLMNQMIAQTTTNASGIYSLVAPTPGDYRVRVLKFYPNDQFTSKDMTADTTDSDIIPTGTNAGFTDVYTFASNLISITSIDIGFRYLAPPPTPTFTPTPTQTIPAPNAPPSLNFSRQSLTRFSWNTVSWAVGYEVEVDDNANFSSPVYTNRTLTAADRTAMTFLPYVDAVYYWRVGAKRADGTVIWSAAQILTVDVP